MDFVNLIDNLIEVRQCIPTQVLSPEQKKRFSEVLCVFRIPREQRPDSLLSGKFPSLRKSEYRWSNSLKNTLRSHLSSPTAVFYHHAGANCSAGILLLEEIQG
jgi:hypothetical protein